MYFLFFLYFRFAFSTILTPITSFLTHKRHLRFLLLLSFAFLHFLSTMPHSFATYRMCQKEHLKTPSSKSPSFHAKPLNCLTVQKNWLPSVPRDFNSLLFSSFLTQRDLLLVQKRASKWSEPPTKSGNFLGGTKIPCSFIVKITLCFGAFFYGAFSLFYFFWWCCWELV